MRRTSSTTTMPESRPQHPPPGASADGTPAAAHPRRRDRVELRMMRDREGALVVSGDLDADSAGALERVLLPMTSEPAGGDRSAHAERSNGQQAGGSTIVIDVRGVEFMDSSGLRTLVSASLRAGRRGGRVVLRNVGPRLWRLLEITGLNDHFGIVRSESRTGEGTNGPTNPSALDRAFHR